MFLGKDWGSVATNFACLVSVLVLVIQPVPGQDMNLNETKLVNCSATKHVLFEGSVEGLDTALLPGWNNTDDFDHWTPPIEYQRLLPSYISGFDNSNRPIWVLEIGKLNLGKLLKGTEVDHQETAKYLRYLAWLGYKSHSLKSTKEHPVTQHIKILDFEGFKPELLTNLKPYNFMRKLAFRYKKYLEKYVSRLIVINVNFVGEIILSLFSQGQMRRFAMDVEVYGTNKYEWGPKLAKSVPVDQLPEWYGGKKDFNPVFVIG